MLSLCISTSPSTCWGSAEQMAIVLIIIHMHNALPRNNIYQIGSLFKAFSRSSSDRNAARSACNLGSSSTAVAAVSQTAAAPLRTWGITTQVWDICKCCGILAGECECVYLKAGVMLVVFEIALLDGVVNLSGANKTYSDARCMR